MANSFTLLGALLVLSFVLVIKGNPIKGVPNSPQGEATIVYPVSFVLSTTTHKSKRAVSTVITVPTCIPSPKGPLPPVGSVITVTFSPKSTLIFRSECPTTKEELKDCPLICRNKSQSNGPLFCSKVDVSLPVNPPLSFCKRCLPFCKSEESPSSSSTTALPTSVSTSTHIARITAKTTSPPTAVQTCFFHPPGVVIDPPPATSLTQFSPPLVFRHECPLSKENVKRCPWVCVSNDVPGLYCSKEDLSTLTPRRAYCERCLPPCDENDEQLIIAMERSTRITIGTALGRVTSASTTHTTPTTIAVTTCLILPSTVTVDPPAITTIRDLVFREDCPKTKEGAAACPWLCTSSPLIDIHYCSPVDRNPLKELFAKVFCKPCLPPCHVPSMSKRSASTHAKYQPDDPVRTGSASTISSTNAFTSPRRPVFSSTPTASQATACFIPPSGVLVDPPATTRAGSVFRDDCPKTKKGVATCPWLCTPLPFISIHYCSTVDRTHLQIPRILCRACLPPCNGPLISKRLENAHAASQTRGPSRTSSASTVKSTNIPHPLPWPIITSKPTASAVATSINSASACLPNSATDLDILPVPNDGKNTAYYVDPSFSQSHFIDAFFTNILRPTLVPVFDNCVEHCFQYFDKHGTACFSIFLSFGLFDQPDDSRQRGWNCQLFDKILTKSLFVKVPANLQESFLVGTGANRICPPTLTQTSSSRASIKTIAKSIVTRLDGRDIKIARNPPPPPGDKYLRPVCPQSSNKTAVVQPRESLRYKKYYITPSFVVTHELSRFRAAPTSSSFTLVFAKQCIDTCIGYEVSHGKTCRSFFVSFGTDPAEKDDPAKFVCQIFDTFLYEDLYVLADPQHDFSFSVGENRICLREQLEGRSDVDKLKERDLVGDLIDSLLKVTNDALRETLKATICLLGSTATLVQLPPLVSGAKTYRVNDAFASAHQLVNLTSHLSSILKFETFKASCILACVKSETAQKGSCQSLFISFTVGLPTTYICQLFNATLTPAVYVFADAPIGLTITVGINRLWLPIIDTPIIDTVALAKRAVTASACSPASTGTAVVPVPESLVKSFFHVNSAFASTYELARFRIDGATRSLISEACVQRCIDFVDGNCLSVFSFSELARFDGAMRYVWVCQLFNATLSGEDYVKTDSSGSARLGVGISSICEKSSGRARSEYPHGEFFPIDLQDGLTPVTPEPAPTRVSEQSTLTGSYALAQEPSQTSEQHQI